MPFYSMAFALSGVMCGVFHRQGRLAAALAYVLSNALAVLWTWSEGLHLSLLYEVFIASVVFLVLPERALRQVGALVAREPRHDTQERARAYVRARMEATAAAFKSLYESMRSAFHPAAPNDNDAASVFDRAAGRICKRCPLQTACWQRDYVSTFNALNDALPAMLERGRGESGDFPAYFSNRCMKFPEFLSAANEELAALLCRRQFQSRLSENRSAVCRQYAELAGVLNTAAAELGAELIVSHHPVIFRPAKSVTDGDPDGRVLLALAEHRIAAICAHTNLDAVAGGVNDALAQKLGLVQIEQLHQDGVDGSGRPYGIGRVGSTTGGPMYAPAFAAFVKEALGANGVRYVDARRPVRRVAVGGGACADLLRDALALGCDTFVTADVKYNGFLDAKALGVNLIDAGHYPTEQVVCPVLAKWLAAGFPQVEILSTSRHKEAFLYL